MLAQKKQEQLSTDIDKKSFKVVGKLTEEHQVICSEQALAFLSVLCEQYANRVDALLAVREQTQARIDAG